MVLKNYKKSTIVKHKIIDTINQGRYLTLNKTKKDGTSNIVAVIQAPILKSKNNEFSVLNNILTI